MTGMPVQSFVGFVVGDVEYALPIQSVREVTLPQTLSPVPHPRRGVVGVADLRGVVVSVVDLRLVMNASCTQVGKWILIEQGQERTALVVDRVTGVFRASIALEEPPSDLRSRGEGIPPIVFVTRRERAIVFALDPDALLSG